MTNIVDVARASRAGRPRLIKKIFSNAASLSSRGFNEPFEEALQDISYAKQLRSFPLFAAALSPIESASHLLSFYADHSAVKIPVDPVNKSWPNWIRVILLETCQIPILTPTWSYMLLSFYHDRIIIRLYRNKQEYENHLVWRRILITPYEVIRGDQSLQEVWP